MSEAKDNGHCCKIGCKNKAEYQIWSGNKPDDYTESCLDCIPDLMTNKKHHEIDRI